MEAISPIQRASQDDIPEIYSLMVEAFGSRFLSYTIYQSPKSVSYLKRLSSSNLENNGQALVVLRREGRIQGYYQAFASAKKYFLNYIAVRSTSSGKGFGSVLLSHFEDKGKMFNCTQYKLDVFEQNRRALEWYNRKGYEKESESIMSRIALGIIDKRGPKLRCESGTWDAAVNQENEKGFSQLECSCGQGSIVLGLINGNVCKLLKYEGISFEESVLSINDYFAGSKRDSLIVSSTSLLASDWPLRQQDRVFRLAKNVAA